MARTSRLPEYQAFIDAKEVLDKTNADYVKYDNYVIIKRNVWESSIERTKEVLKNRQEAEKAIFNGKFS